MSTCRFVMFIVAAIPVAAGAALNAWRGSAKSQSVQAPGREHFFSADDWRGGGDAMRYLRMPRVRTAAFQGATGITNSSSMYVYNTSEPWAVPTHVDWSGSLVVGPVINHGHCGSCFVAAAKDALESAYFLDTGNVTKFSMQDMMDCSWMYSYHNETNAGCDGGAYQAIYDWARDFGLVLDSADRPYRANDSTCSSARATVRWRPHGYVTVPDDEDLIKHALAHHGPLAVSMYTAYPAFDHYPGHDAIMLPPRNCSEINEHMLDHSMLLVGYGSTSDGTPYWKVKNNWGTEWGDAGYFKLFRNWDCGLRTSVALVARTGS